MTQGKGLIFGAFLIGLTSMLGQILILRELLTVFYGNELAIGIVLASWLFWVSAGSLLGAKIKYNLGLAQLLNAVILPINISVLTFLPKIMLGFTPGEIIGLFPMLGFSFLILAPIGVSLGAAWAIACKSATQNKDEPARIGHIYIYEGIGAATGGLLFNFILAKLVTPYTSCFILSCLNLISALLLFKKPILKVGCLFLIIADIFFVSLRSPAAMEKYLKQLRFSPLEIVSSKDSIYGNVTLTRYGRHGLQYSLFENGLHLFTTKDILTQEETAHYPLLQHPNPKNVLLIGGGLGGTISELLKHPVESIDYCELDPLVIELSEIHLPEEELIPLKDQRVKIHYIDGRLFIKKSPKYTYDVVIVNLPEPFTAQVNRFYSLEFYKEVEKILKPPGLVSFSVTSSENYISPHQGRLLSSIFKTLSTVFADVKVFPGDTNYFFASNTPEQLTTDPGILLARLKNRKIKTQYVESYARFKLAPDRVAYLNKAIRESKEAKINKDFAPIGYFYDMVLWSSHFSSNTQAIFNALYRLNVLWFVAPIIIGFVFLAFITKRNMNLPIYTSILATGTSELVFQIIVILAFQVIYGYVYYKIGLIFGSFMAGLVFGSILVNKNLNRFKNDYLVYIISQATIVMYPLILPAAFFILSHFKEILAPSLTESIFIILPSVAGFIGGWQFPLANKICASSDYAKKASLLYGLDLLGSSLGALCASSVLLPILGITTTCALLALVNFLVFLLLLITRRISGR